ncbi:MAG: hypothetical protein PHG00_14570 [Methylococcales bacterium]|nr:hypothetical protein [Methylococcales bacterium]
MAGKINSSGFDDVLIKNAIVYDETHADNSATEEAGSTVVILSRK